MSAIPYLCRIPGTWTKSGEFDAGAYGAYIERLIESDIGVLMGTPSTGERVLSMSELTRLYKTGVEVAKGKVLIGASGIEENTATETIERSKPAVEAGVDIIGIYGPAGFHGYRPTDDEYLAYWDNIFNEIDYPVLLGPNSHSLFYLINPVLVAQVCETYPQIKAVSLTGVDDEMFFVALKALLKPEVKIYAGWKNSMEMLSYGADGIAGFAAGLLPKTMRAYLDHFQAKELEEASKCYYHARRYERFAQQNNWGTREAYLGMRALKLPGGDGNMPEPFIMPDDTELEKYTAGILALNIPEINEMARAAGLSVPDSAA